MEFRNYQGMTPSFGKRLPQSSPFFIPRRPRARRTMCTELDAQVLAKGSPFFGWWEDSHAIHGFCFLLNINNVVNISDTWWLVDDFMRLHYPIYWVFMTSCAAWVTTVRQQDFNSRRIQSYVGSRWSCCLRTVTQLEQILLFCMNTLDADFVWFRRPVYWKIGDFFRFFANSLAVFVNSKSHGLAINMTSFFHGGPVVRWFHQIRPFFGWGTTSTRGWASWYCGWLRNPGITSW